jgi:hypothetical protein
MKIAAPTLREAKKRIKITIKITITTKTLRNSRAFRSVSGVNMVLTDFRQSLEYAAIEVRVTILEGRKT